MFSEICLAEATANRRHKLPLSPGLGKHVYYLANSWEKQVLSISMVKTEGENFSSSTRKLIFQACVDFTSCKRPAGKVSFFNLSFFFFFNPSQRLPFWNVEYSFIVLTPGPLWPEMVVPVWAKQIVLKILHI